MIRKKIKQLVAPVLIPASRAVVRYSPLGQRLVWNTVCRRLQWEPHPFVVRTRPGFLFSGENRDLVSRYIYHFGTWEPAITNWICSLPLRGRTVVDVGTHLGWYSLLASRCVGDKGSVVSIEASPANFAGVARNVALNRMRNIRLIQAAAWNTAEDLPLFARADGEAGTTTVVNAFLDLGDRAGYRQRGTVRGRPLASLLRPSEVARAGLIKIDVEGAEWQVIQGLLPVFANLPGDVRFLLELTPETLPSGIRAEDIIDLFAARGFHACIFPNEYKPEFYLGGRQSPMEIQGPLTHQVDLMFARKEPGRRIAAAKT